MLQIIEHKPSSPEQFLDEIGKEKEIDSEVSD